MDEIYVKCSCYGEGIYVKYEQEDKLYYLSFFSLGYRAGKLSIIDRIRWVWQIFKNGKPFDDQVVLNKNEAKNLADFIRSKNIDI